MALSKIYFDDMVFYTGEFKDFVDFIMEKYVSYNNQKIIITYINLRNYYYLHKDKKLKEEINKNCIMVFEGIGMKIGFLIKGYGLLPDLNGTDIFPLLMSKISELNLGIFLLGSQDNIIKKAAENLLIKYPGINLKGYYNGYFLKKDEPCIINIINNCNTDVLFVGMGFPIQEEFILRNINKINAPLILNVAGLFDTFSGYKTRAPYLVRKIRLEWLYRFIKEPRRMLQRNTVAAFWSLKHIIFNCKK
jgi:N-acetylglucosaminyldiphosphoundecaprenol N-acetyl-beta-D-mannosaminyltransferase